mgnify:FL=1
MRGVFLLLAAVAVAGPAETLTGVVRTEHFEIRYRPGSRAGASAPRVAVMAERDLARICELLGIENDGRYQLFLYDGLPELHAITGTSGNAGFSAGNQTHVPHDNDQTRFHELVHVVAYRLPKPGDEPRNLFFAEGLANALLEHVHGVHVHAVAAFYRKRKQLPPLAEMTGPPDFYAWLHRRPGFNAYDVGASWFRFLLDTHGAEKVRRYYTGTGAQDAFGTPPSQLEKEWHALLDARELAPEVETLLAQRAGEAARFERYPLTPDERLPPELLGKPRDWKDLSKERLRPGAADAWSREGDALHGESGTPDWSWCEFGKREHESCALRARIRPSPGCLGVQVRLGERCQAMLVRPGTFLFDRGQALASTPDHKLTDGVVVDLLLVRRGDDVEIWIDGVLVLKARGASQSAPAGVGVAGGEATFEEVRVRSLG